MRPPKTNNLKGHFFKPILQKFMLADLHEFYFIFVTCVALKEGAVWRNSYG